MPENGRTKSDDHLRVFAESPEAFFTEGLLRIERERMAGLPVLNPKIAVRSSAWRRWGNDWIGVMVTPWAILAVCACGSRDGWVPTPAGRERLLELPSGDYPFVSMDDPILGRFLLLSLMSPILDVADQETADVIGKTAFDALFSVQAIPEDDEDASVWVAPQSDGALRRVIPIKVTPPKGYENTPALTPPPPEPPEEREPFFERKLSRRALFGRVEKPAVKPESSKTPQAPASPSQNRQTDPEESGSTQ